MRVKTISLLITRDAMTILPVIVPAHEYAIQKAVHGAENVRRHESEETPEPVEIDEAGEIERLQSKYGPPALEKAFGSNYEAAISGALESAAVPDGDSVAASDGATKLYAMDKSELLAEAERRGVLVDPGKTKAEIKAAIEAASS